jgi:hypothetical protein
LYHYLEENEIGDELLEKESMASKIVGVFSSKVSVYKLNPVVTHSLKAPGFNP